MQLTNHGIVTYSRASTSVVAMVGRHSADSLRLRRRELTLS